jgi:two-component system, cell cycle sensor histidine kinase and response regulator CckA
LPSTIAIQQDTVKANPTQIHQIMMNLFTNAAHAMRDNGGILDVVLREEWLNVSLLTGLPDLEPGRYLRLSVRDSGSGRDRRTMDQIFTLFLQPKPGTKGQD